MCWIYPSKNYFWYVIKVIINFRGDFADVCVFILCGLQAHIGLLLPPALSALVDKQSHSALKIEVLSFLRIALQPSNKEAFAPRLPALVDSLVHSLNDRYYKVVSEALCLCETIATMMQPTPGDAATLELAKKLFDAVLKRLSANDQDQDVKEHSIRCIATMVTHFSGVLTAQSRSVLTILTERLNNDSTRLAAVRAFESVARAPHPVDMNHVCAPKPVDVF